MPDSTLLVSESFTAATLSELRHRVAAAVEAAGVSGARAEDFVLAVHELAANAIQHGGGTGDLTLSLLDDVLTCEIVDHGPGAGDLPVRPADTDRAGGRGLWLAHQLTGSLMLTRRPDGVSGSVSICVTEVPAPRPAPKFRNQKEL